MEFRARFAPSPTGQVHIGNIRTAIFNWLTARHAGGVFLLRIEDTDLERSTKEAIDTLLDCMKWLGMDYDEAVMYQTEQAPKHVAAAHLLLDAGHAYKPEPGSDNSPLCFRIPYDCSTFDFVRVRGEVVTELFPGSAVSVSRAGLTFQIPSPKGKPVDAAGCLAGFLDLTIEDASGMVLFRLTPDEAERIRNSGDPLVVESAARIRFVRREVFFHDLVKGDLSKPLDSMKDLVILRSDGSPVFHLANVQDDITQNVTHIVRGDDHVENTYRHLFLFALLGAKPPVYAHLPMIVNAQGKPFSKRDGDAFVGDFKSKGFLPEALFNALSLLGWSPGDNREKMSRGELIEAFQIERAQRSPAQFDFAKLANMNGQYIAELPVEDFSRQVRDFADGRGWFSDVEASLFNRVCALMQSRTKILTDIESWRCFFCDEIVFDQKAVRKNLSDPTVLAVLPRLADQFEQNPGADKIEVEKILRFLESESGLKEFSLNQPLRVAITGSAVGADMYETVVLIGLSRSASRIRNAVVAKQNGHL